MSTTLVKSPESLTKLMSNLSLQTCNICMQSLNTSPLFHLDCNHNYHSNCIKQLIETAIGGQSYVEESNISCPECKRQIQLSSFENLISSANLSKLRAHLAAKVEEAKQAREKVIDEEFVAASKALGYKKCPHCSFTVERISGCNFLKCHSPTCKGKNNFCFLCEKPLSDNYSSHFKAQGSSGKVCNTMDGNKDT